MDGNIDPSTPREMQRSSGPKSAALVHGPSLFHVVFHIVPLRLAASGVSGGKRPSGGSMTRADAVG